MRAEVLDRVVREYQGKSIKVVDVRSRVRCEEIIRFAYDLAKENGQEKLAENIYKLIQEVDEIDTEELVRLGTFRG